MAGKDRAALMMAGPTADEIYWWTGEGFGPAASPNTATENATIARTLQSGAPAMAVPDWCAARTQVVGTGERDVGNFRFPVSLEREPRDRASDFRASPRLDAATLDIALRMAREGRLGLTEGRTDVLAVGLSATDYVGHTFGTNGVESCITLAEIDKDLERFFDGLDAMGIDYVAVLTADHGGLDLPERQSQQAMPQARRVDPALVPETLGRQLAGTLGLSSPVLLGEAAFGDIYVDPALSARDKTRALAAARDAYAAHPDVRAAYTSAQIMAVPLPTGNPRDWSVLERLRASHYPGRSGDLMVVLQPGVTPIPEPGYFYVATHGSPWDYDRRVPIMFWRKGMVPFEQVLPAMTVDIAPTLAALAGLELPAGTFDGRCLDLDPGRASTCR